MMIYSFALTLSLFVTEVEATVCRPLNSTELTSEMKKISQSVETVLKCDKLSSAAEQMVKSLVAKGYTCETKQEWIQLHGIACKGKVDGYSKPVRLFIPANYEKNPTQNVMQIFFHGLTQTSNGFKFDTFQINKNDQQGYADFGARLQLAGANKSIVVMPESDNNSVTFLNELAKDKGQAFLRFTNQIEEQTGQKFSKMALAGHSNGYLPINTLLGFPEIQNKVSHVAIFDGTYRSTQNVTAWLNAQPSRKAWISWAEGGDVVQTSKAFVDRVKNKNQVTTTITNKTGRPFSIPIHFENVKEGGYSDYLRMVELP